MFGKKAAEEAVKQSLGIIDKAVTDKDKKQDLAADVVQNEMVSGSPFVRNARPLIVYAGLFVILCEVFGIRLFILSHIEGENIIKQSTSLMEYFLFTWSGVVSVYVGSRTFEKAKMRNLRKARKGN